MVGDPFLFLMLSNPTLNSFVDIPSLGVCQHEKSIDFICKADINFSNSFLLFTVKSGFLVGCFFFRSYWQTMSKETYCLNLEILLNSTVVAL